MFAVRVVGIDISRVHLEQARQWDANRGISQMEWVVGNGFRLPLATGSVDFVMSSLVLHHFAPGKLDTLLRECRRVARRGIVMSDLWCHPLPFALYRLLEPFFVRSPITRHDGRASFQRAYTPVEMLALASPLLPGVQVVPHFPSFRWVMEWYCPAHWTSPASVETFHDGWFRF